jgi:hypothetical protein
MMPVWLLNPKLLAALALAAALLGLVWWVHHDGVVSGRAEIQAILDKTIADVNAEKAKLIADNTAKTQKLQGEADAQKVMDAAALAMANTRADAVIAGLRNRPERPARAGGVPAPASTCVAASGAQLARGDAEFLVRFALDAARAQLAAEQCQAAYNSARALINGP